MSKVIVEVKKGQNESNATLLRRFSRRVMDTGTIQKVKSERYHERPASKRSLKEVTLRRIARRAANAKLEKLGKLKKREHRGR
jgi:ribosomal protein S21